MTEWTMIGVPSSAGAHHAGQELAPAALRAAGLLDQLAAAGVQATDRGDLPGATFEVDCDHPRARNLPAVLRVIREVADAVADVVAAGKLPLVVGGDCTITLGVVAGFRRRYPRVGLAYVDGDADLSSDEAGDSGILDSAGIAHLLGLGSPELNGFDGAPPLLDASRIAMLGCDPREVTATRRQFLAEAAGDPVQVREHSHRVREAQADDHGPVPCPDRRQHERKPRLLPQRDGQFHRRCQALGHRLPGVAEPPLLIEVVDGGEPLAAGAVTDEPVVTAAADGGVPGGGHVDLPAAGQDIAEVTIADTRWPVPHEGTGYAGVSREAIDFPAPRLTALAQARSNRSRFMTLPHAAAKSRTNFSCASSLA